MQLRMVMVKEYGPDEKKDLREDTHDISAKGGRFEIHLSNEGLTRVVVRCREYSYTWIRCKAMGYIWCYINT